MSDGQPALSPAPLTVTTHVAGDGGVRLAAAGEIDISSVGRLHAALTAALHRQAPVVVDLAEVTFLDSPGISALVSAHHNAAAHGAARTVINCHGAVRRTLEITGVLRTLTTPTTSDERPPGPPHIRGEGRRPATGKLT